MKTIKLGMTSKKVLNIIRENNTESESETVKNVHTGMTGNEFRKALNTDLSAWAEDENYPEITNKSSDEVVRERFNTAASDEQSNVEEPKVEQPTEPELPNTEDPKIPDPEDENQGGLDGNNESSNISESSNAEDNGKE